MPTLGAEQLQQLMLQMLNNQNTALQQQQNQMNFLMQAQSAQLTLLTRRFDEEEARRKAEEARRAVSADPFAAASAGGTSAAPTTSPVAPPGVPASTSFSSGATSSFGGRAEKYLPSLPLINHGEMRAGRIRELEKFHRFLEVVTLQEEVPSCFTCCNKRWRSGTEDWRSSGVSRHAKETLQLVTKVCESCTANIRLIAEWRQFISEMRC